MATNLGSSFYHHRREKKVLVVGTGAQVRDLCLSIVLQKVNTNLFCTNLFFRECKNVPLKLFRRQNIKESLGLSLAELVMYRV